MRNIILALAVILAIGLPSSVLASDTEADAIHDVLFEWSGESDRAGDADMHTGFAVEALQLWNGLAAGTACETYAGRVFSIISLAGLSATLASTAALETMEFLFESLDDAEYACRISL